MTDEEKAGTKFLFTAVSATSGVRAIVGPAFYAQPSGGGVINGRIAYSSLAPDEFLEIIQGEEKVLTFIVEADGRFDQAEADSISIKLKDPAGNTVSKNNSTITRVTQELDVQVFRVTLDADDTSALAEGLLRIEIALDTQKTVVTHALKIIEAL